jgi:S1-C subfamily serine protease
MKTKVLSLASLVLISAMLLSGCSGLAALSQGTGQVNVAQAAQQSSAVSTPANSTNSNSASTINNNSALQTSTIPNSDLLNAYQSTLESIYSTINPQVVNISVLIPATSSDFQNFPGLPNGNNNNNNNQTPQYSQALGSGFFWDANGNIVTNNHVVDGATKIEVTLSDGSTVPATIVGQDPYSDLAVIKVSLPADKIHPVTMADSTQVKVGEIAVAIGNPYGFEGSMSVGNVSGLGRDLPSSTVDQTTGASYSIPDIIQTDASINPGNSGGVLVDIQGEVIGVTSAIESNSGSSSGVGFAIPSEIVSKVVPSLISSGKYEHPYLGISGTDMTPDIAQAMNLPTDTRGALVATVVAGGPAANAGLMPSETAVTINGTQGTVGGDVITAIDGTPITSMSDLIAYLAIHTQVDQTINLTILRNGQTQTVQLTLGSRPSQ